MSRRSADPGDAGRGCYFGSGLTGGLVDKIFLYGIQFYGYHGVKGAEQELGQRFSVDVELSLDLRAAAREDSLKATVNYSDVHRMVIEIGTREKFKLLETLAERIAAALLDKFAPAQVVVRARKIAPPIKGVVEAAGVEVRRP